MKCEEVQHAIWSGLITPEDTLHLDTCPACQGEYALMQKIVHDLKPLDTPQPSRSLKPSRDVIEKAVRNNKRLPFVRMTSIAASVVLLITAGTVVAQQFSAPPTVELTPGDVSPPKPVDPIKPPADPTPDPVESTKVAIEVDFDVSKDKLNIVNALKEYLEQSTDPAKVQKVVLQNVSNIVQPGDNRIVAYVDLNYEKPKEKLKGNSANGSNTVVTQFLRNSDDTLKVETFASRDLADQPDEIVNLWAQSLRDQNAVLQWATLDENVQGKLLKNYAAANWTLVNERGKVVKEWRIDSSQELDTNTREFQVLLYYDQAHKDSELAKVMVNRSGDGFWHVSQFASANRAPGETPSSNSGHEGETVFDPTRVKVGDKIGQMRLESLELVYFNDGQLSSVVASFSGRLKVSGRYQFFEEKAEFVGNQIFFYPDSESSKLFPLLLKDERGTTTQFRLRNQEEAKKHFGKPGSMGDATVEIENFTINYVPKEIWDEATLVNAISVGP